MCKHLTHEFIEGRRLHLVNRRKVTIDRSTVESSMPEAHRQYKLFTVLPAIDAALQRIEAGDYGYCHDCGEGIPQKRLELRPEACRCVSCQEAFEKVNSPQEVVREHPLFARA
jgi:RNA polymerase-binding protein DksA